MPLVWWLHSPTFVGQDHLGIGVGQREQRVPTMPDALQGACDMGHGSDVITELREPTRLLRRAAPEAWAGFSRLHDAAMADGALAGRVKELMALALAVVKQCDGCIAYHAKAAARAGATPEEVAETMSVAMLMDGGPATTYGPRAFAAFLEFLDQADTTPPRERVLASNGR